jgi:hypothetical protein
MKTITGFYETPEARIQELQAEGMLCTSLKDAAVEDFDYKEFEW